MSTTYDGGDICEDVYESRAAALHDREFYRTDVIAVLELEHEGVRCPSTFDGGAYLRHCIAMWREAANAARRMR